MNWNATIENIARQENELSIHRENVLMFILTSHATEKAHYDPLLQNIEKILGVIRLEKD